MRVLWLIDSLGPGGAESLMLPLLKSLQSRVEDPRVCVLYVRGGNPMAVELEKMGVPVDLVPVRNLHDLGGIQRLYQYIRQLRPDMIHTQLETSNILGALIGRLLGIRSVATMHTLDVQAGKLRKRLRNWVHWKALNTLTSRVIFVSEFTRQHFIRLGFRESRLVTLYNGIETRLFGQNAARPSKAHLLGVPENAVIASTVAVLREPKGIQHMLRAMPALLAQLPGLYYVVAGDGAYRLPLETLARELGVAGRVLFLGQRSDIPNILAASDLFVYPTLQDALPTALLEAMASGVPIVASRVDGVPEILEDGVSGLLVPPADAPALAAACLRLLCDEALVGQLTVAARRTIEERFSIQRQSGLLLDLYEQVRAGKGA